MRFFNSRPSGQSIVELLVGLAIAALFIVGSATIIAPSLEINKQTTVIQTETELGSELLNNVRTWAGGNWNVVLALATGTANSYFLNTSVSPFAVPTSSAGYATGTEVLSQFIGTGSTTYKRYFYLGSVYRDTNGNATTSASGNNYDPSTMLVTVVVQASSTPVTPALVFTEYLTRNQDNVISQASWAGGSGQNNPVTVIGTNFAVSTNTTINASGSIQLAASGVSCIQ
jgi:hypothetical protein